MCCPSNTLGIMERNGIFSKLPQYVLISYFKLNFPDYNLAPFLFPLPSYMVRKIAFHYVHYISTPIYRVISPPSLLDTRLNMFSSLTSSSRVLFLKHFIIFVALHWASLDLSLWGNLFQIASLMKENSRVEKNVKPTLSTHVALHTFRGSALIMGWLWMLFYKLAPKNQEENIQSVVKH